MTLGGREPLFQTLALKVVAAELLLLLLEGSSSCSGAARKLNDEQQHQEKHLRVILKQPAAPDSQHCTCLMQGCKEE
ncbi:hypothetical protein TSUD_246560 [Trifolium subterraneum]|uniref:Secreted protein n=1 Tax=Trifolium subterraneum TaxID=3900 RepID=A0A2Z6NRL1_TRISU|nr:hypothetical protein TSUD_246560 [Trifolium subterraneum]